jgi:alpha-galactosidase
MLIDSCASGGRRNDLETLRRAVPLLRSDYIFEPIGNQCHTYGIAFWMPFYGTGTLFGDTYHFRSVMCPHLTGCYDVRRKDLDYDAICRLVAEWKQVAPYFMGDYYPLTSYSQQNDVWIGWQFDRPDLGEGMVQVFRRDESIYESARLPLRGLDHGATYTVSDLDSQSSERLSGRELMEKGLRVNIADRPGAAVITYRKLSVENR